MAIRFDAYSSEWLERTSDVLDANGVYTLMGWFYFPSVVENWSTVLMQCVGADGYLWADYIQIDQSAAPHFVLGVNASEITCASVSTETWHHLTLVREASNVLRFYINGSLEATNTTGIGLRPAINTNWIGTQAAPATSLNARVAGLKAWSAALTQAEVQNEMQKIPAIRRADLHGEWWTFPGSGERVRDYSGNGRNWTEHGTLTDEDPPPVSFGASAIVPPLLAAAGGVTVNLNAATLSASGQAVTVSAIAPTTVSVNAAALSASGQAVTIVPGAATISVGAAALSALGQTISVSAPVGGALIPAGVICIWPGTHASIPKGWTRVTALDGLYPKGAADATNPGGTGGANTHQHTTSNHTHAGSQVHTVPDSPQGSGSTNRDAGSVRPPATHTHTGNPNTANPTVNTLTNDAPSTDSPNSEPPYFVGIFIESDGTPTGFPATAIIAWDGASAPSGWTFCDGSGSTPDLRGLYIKGAAALGNGGGTGGAATHSHTVASHTHGTNYSHAHPNVTSSQTGASMVGGPLGGANVGTATQTHQHALTIGTQATDAITGNTDSTDTPNHEPPYVLLGWIQNTSGGLSYPDQSIALWVGTLVNIPTDWDLCNGTGTTDTRSRFIKGATTLAGVGTTGGNLTHSHTATGHTHAVASHAHTVSAANGAGSNETAGEVACSTTAHTHPSWSDTGAQSFTSGSGTPTVTDYTDTQPSYYAVAWIQYTVSITPTTVNLNAATLSASGQVVTVVTIAPTTVSLNGATLSAVGQTITVVAGAVSVVVAAATLTANGQVLTAAPGAVSVLFSAATLTASGQALTVVPGAVSSSLLAATLTAQGQTISILPGAVSSSLAAASIAALGQTTTISLITDVVIGLLAANLTAQGQVATTVGGPVAVDLSAATLVAGGQVVNVVPGSVGVSLTAASLLASGQASSVVPGEFRMALLAATLAAQGQAASIVPGAVSTTLTAATLAALGQVVTISNISGLVVGLDTAILAAQGQTISPLGGPVSSSLSVATLTATGQTVSIVPGATSFTVSVATLSALGQVITPVGGPISSVLDAANLSAQGQTITVVPGTASISLDAATLTEFGQNVTISAPPGGLVEQLFAAVLTAAGQTVAIVPGATSTTLESATLRALGQPVVATPETIPTVFPGQYVGGTFEGPRPDYKIEYQPEVVAELLRRQIEEEDEELLWLISLR